MIILNIDIYKTPVYSDSVILSIDFYRASVYSDSIIKNMFVAAVLVEIGCTLCMLEISRYLHVIQEYILIKFA